MPDAVGVDGCPAGWFASWQEHGQLKGDIYATFAALLADHPGAQVLIDIPVGLGATERTLEHDLRRVLGTRSRSVFNAPVRSVLAHNDYAAASAANAAATGKKLTLQSWHICGKIREVDEQVRRHPSHAKRIIECHPELAFAGLGGQPCEYRKHDAAGRTERQALLRACFEDFDDWLVAVSSRTRRADVGVDDMLDSLALLALSLRDFALWHDSVPDPTGVPIRMAVPRAYAERSGKR